MIQGIRDREKQEFAWKGSALPAVCEPLAGEEETKLITGGSWSQDLWAQSSVAARSLVGGKTGFLEPLEACP